MEPQERYYNVKKLNKIFAIVSLVLLTALGALFLKDYVREWKDYQTKFHALEMEKARVKFDLESNQLKKDPEYQKLSAELNEAKKEYQQNCVLPADIETKIAKSKTEIELISQEFRTEKAKMDAAKYRYEEAIEKLPVSIPAAGKEYRALQQKVNKLQLKLDHSEQQLKSLTQKNDACGENLRELDRQERALSTKAELLQKKLESIDPDAMSIPNLVANAVRDLPVLEMSNPRNKIEQIVLKELTEDVNFAKVPRVDRCITCHLGISNPDYKDAPQPFTAHPNLELYLGKNSPHKMDEFGCTVCHGGRGRGTDFISTVHTPSSEQQKEDWEEKYHWHKIHHWETPMLPMNNIEASCFKCHSGEMSLKGAEKLNLGMQLIEKSGCYSCHTIEKYKNWPKPGPDLSHIASKLSPDWTYQWINDPKAFRHNTWMPSFFNQSNNSDQEALARAQQEIHAIVHYLFEVSQEFKTSTMPNWGDPKKGEELVTSIGCMGCHVIEKEPSMKQRTNVSLLREQGPNLTGLGSKTSKVWLYNWLKDPNRYHPETKMPNLRLSDSEAADIAAYLVQDKNADFAQTPIPPVNEKELSAIIEGFLKKTLTHDQAKAKIVKMPLTEKLSFAGKKLIGQYGCYSCHNINGFENTKPIGTELTEEGSKPADKLDFGFIDIEHSREAWFAQKLKDPRSFDHNKIKAPDEKLRMPNYHFTDEEIDAIVTALLGFVKEKPDAKMIKPRTPQNLYIEKGQEIVRQFNCQGCHMIEGTGGAIKASVEDWLVKFDNRSEDEAKALSVSFGPPDLIGEGKKVHTQWLFNFLHQPTPIRPWLKVRMPTYQFSTAQLNSLVKFFTALDNEEFPFTEPADGKYTPEELEQGEKLFSKEYFGCAACHIVGDKMPSGSPESWAPDFTLSKTRLKPEWIIEWIKNPQSLLPGTKMPNFFDVNNYDSSGPEDIFNGDEDRQIKALRDYILTLTNSPKLKKATPPPAQPGLQALPQNNSN